MKILEMKSTVTETKNAFSKLISPLGIAKERICKLQDRPVQIKLKCRETNVKKYSRASISCEITSNGLNL